MKIFKKGPKKPLRVCLHTPPPELTQTIANRPRACPICKTNVDWLPCYTPCPKCGYKAVPRINEMPYSENIKAKEILRDFYFREHSSDPIDCRAAVYNVNDSDDDCDDVQPGQEQPCPHCKICKACKHVFGNKFELCSKIDQVPPTPMYSTQLQSMFCDIKDLFDKADDLKQYEYREQCENYFQDHEEKEIKHRIIGDARYEPCKDLQRIKQRMSQCRSLDITNGPSVSGACIKKKKTKRPRKKW